MKLGLKLWSNNTDSYLIEAEKLYKDGIYNYIELYVVPDTVERINKWKKLDIPFTLHAPHFAHGVNLAKKEHEDVNFKIFDEVKQFSKELNAEYIVVHSGIDGRIEETVRQLKEIKLENMLIENKPYRALPNKMKGEFCRGATFEEIKFVIDEIKCGFCLDIGHSFCSANTINLNPYQYLTKFNMLKPTCYHISDNDINTEFDSHMHFGQGNYNFKKIFGIINTEKNIAIETNKNSKENLDDFVEDVKWLKNLA